MINLCQANECKDDASGQQKNLVSEASKDGVKGSCYKNF